MYPYLTDIMMSSVFVAVLLRNDENHLFRIHIPSGLGSKRICCTSIQSRTLRIALPHV
jgi:hypothetical protein